jgi:hypothetical protein
LLERVVLLATPQPAYWRVAVRWHYLSAPKKCGERFARHNIARTRRPRPRKIDDFELAGFHQRAKRPLADAQLPREPGECSCFPFEVSLSLGFGSWHDAGLLCLGR